MKLVQGDLWSEAGTADLILFTANSTLLGDELVMGAGSAREAKRFCPWLPAMIGRHLLTHDLVLGDFLLWWPADEPWGEPGCTVVGALQTKRRWQDPSPLDLVARSVERLGIYLEAQSTPWQVAMPFPGVGHGGLARELVLPLLEQLPDQVRVYER